MFAYTHIMFFSLCLWPRPTGAPCVCVVMTFFTDERQCVSGTKRSSTGPSGGNARDTHSGISRRPHGERSSETLGNTTRTATQTDIPQSIKIFMRV
ncbi:hypothetical protein BaRGS_00020412 [Batillaria attramentaria]|uniref:Secreted protein n=1 Tax=Batillaria attramentaria TaxID=370345 RepID=A0ABD0KMD6_9CAEN